MAQKFTEASQSILQTAQSEAIRRDHQEFHPEHVLFGLLEKDSPIPGILGILGVNAAALKSASQELLSRFPSVQGGNGNLYPSGNLNRLFVQSEDEAKKM